MLPGFNPPSIRALDALQSSLQPYRFPISCFLPSYSLVLCHFFQKPSPLLDFASAARTTPPFSRSSKSPAGLILNLHHGRVSSSSPMTFFPVDPPASNLLQVLFFLLTSTSSYGTPFFGFRNKSFFFSFSPGPFFPGGMGLFSRFVLVGTACRRVFESFFWRGVSAFRQLTD